MVGCPLLSPTESAGQCDREVIALKEHLEMVQAQLSTCSSGAAKSKLYTELNQVFSGTDVQVDRQGTAIRLRVKVSTLYADPYLLKFRTESEATVGLLASALERNPDAHVLVVGHTNDRPLPQNVRRTYASKVDWSARLAEQLVQRFVESYQCDPAQFTVAGRGEHSPLESNDLETGRDANARLEIWFYEAESPPDPSIP